MALSFHPRRWLLRHWLRLRRSPFVIWRYQGAWLLLDTREKTDRLVILKRKEAAQIRAMLDWIEARPAGGLVDLGANFGLYSVVIGRRVPGLDIHAFEPLPDARTQLEANLLMNGLQDVQVHACAVADTPGRSVFLREAGGHRGGSRLGAGADPPDGSWEPLTVEVARVDDRLPLEGRSLAVKLDLEGGEPAALRGMPRLLTRNECYVQVETSVRRPEHAREVDELLRGYGYRRTAVIDVDHVYRRVG